MITNSFYLYPNVINAYSLEDGATTTQRFRQVYQRNFKVYRGVDNYLDFHVRNQDQKSLDISDKYHVFRLINPETNELILAKDGTFVNDSSYARGRTRIVLSELELLDIEQGYYAFTLSQEVRNYNDTGNYTVVSNIPLYVDSQFDVFATLEVLGDINGDIKDSYSIVEFTKEWETVDTIPETYYSTIINANPETSKPASIHTFAFYSSSIGGTITIQGSQDYGAVPKNWIDLDTFEPSATVAYKNVTGKYNWLRVKHSPSSSTGSEFTIQQTILGSYTVSIDNGGSNYVVGETITIQGSQLGGETPTNNLVITVDAVNANGTITDISWTGNSYNGVRTFNISPDTESEATLDKILYRN